MRNLFKELEKNKIKQLTKINTGKKKQFCHTIIITQILQLNIQHQNAS